MTPMCLKGKTQSVLSLGPPWVVHVGILIDSAGHEERAVFAQSPQLLMTTVPLESTIVAHQGTGDAA